MERSGKRGRTLHAARRRAGALAFADDERGALVGLVADMELHPRPARS